MSNQNISKENLSEVLGSFSKITNKEFTESELDLLVSLFNYEFAEKMSTNPNELDEQAQAAERYRKLRKNWFSLSSEYTDTSVIFKPAPRWSNLPDFLIDQAVDKLPDQETYDE